MVVKIIGAERLFGIRSRIYGVAAACHAVVKDGEPFICYVNGDLSATCYLRTHLDVADFQNRVYDFQDQIPCLSRLEVEFSALPSPFPPFSHYLLKSEYNPDDHGSPVSACSSSVDTPAQLNDYQLYQSLEDPSAFSAVQGEKLHIISKVDCCGPLCHLHGNENNYLYAHRSPFHQLFDGLQTVPRIPLLLILARQILSSPSTRDSRGESRCPVEIELFFFNDTVRGICLPQLRQPFRTDDEFNTAILTVCVPNPNLFVQCLNYRAKQVIPVWDSLRDAPLHPSSDSLRIAYVPAVLGLKNFAIREFRPQVCSSSRVSLLCSFFFV